MKHILYIHQYFKTPKEPGGTRSYWLAKKLIDKGYRVTMLTSSNSIRKNIEIRNVDNIKVVYLKVDYNQSMPILKRLYSFLKFMIRSAVYSLKIKDIDLVFATSTPLTVGFPALVLNKIKKIPFVFEVRDLWPEVPIQMGAMNNPILEKMAIWFEKLLYKNAKHIIALSPGMYNGVVKYVSSKKVSLIPNMAKIDFFWPREKNYSFMKELGLKENSFKLIYFGAMGIANGIDTVINSAELFSASDDVEFIFIGEGAVENELKKYCLNKNLEHVHFLGKYAMKQTSEIVNFCDVSLVSFKDLPILYTNSPNKLFDSLSAGKPIAVNSAGWTKKMVEDNNCGFYFSPSNSSDLVDKVKKIKANKELIELMGENSRKLAEEKYDKEILCEKFFKLIDRFV